MVERRATHLGSDTPIRYACLFTTFDHNLTIYSVIPRPWLEAHHPVTSRTNTFRETHDNAHIQQCHILYGLFLLGSCMSGSKSLHFHDTLLPGGYLYFLELVDFQCFYIAHVSISSTSIVPNSFRFLSSHGHGLHFYFAQGFRMERALAAGYS